MPFFARTTAPRIETILAATALAALTACGGGGGDAATVATAAAPASAPAGAAANAPPASAAAATAMSGTVAVGAPITGGVLRILDAGGTVVAQDIAIDADGHYTVPQVGGTGPWRLEACGYAGGNWRCMYSVANAVGTANVTPFTTALVTLATGAAPAALMQANAVQPTAGALADAQQQLATSVRSTLTDAGITGSLDFVTGTLAAGSRTGYDRLLDAVAVQTGTDNGAFVQLVPRLGDGNVYMTTGSSQGAIVPAAAASGLSLAGIETLFDGISAGMASADACTSSTTGIRQWIADDARMNLGDGGRSIGGDLVAAGLCRMFAGGGGDGGRDSATLWGSRLVSPVLGRCDFTGADPVCGVSLALQGPDGAVRVLGSGVSVTHHAGAWKFYGDSAPISINANAAVQRTRSLDTGTDSYSRALQFDIGVTPGVACARVLQRDATGSETTVAYFKVHAADAPRMSLWMQHAATGGIAPSLDPTSGETFPDSSWVQLPDGTAGDEVIRNFYRAGRFVTVALFSDTGCTAAAVLEGKSEFTVDVDGIPPVSAALASLPWGELGDATKAALQSLTLSAGVASTFDMAWSFPQGSTGFDEATLCVSGECGQGEPGRLSQVEIRPGRLTAHLTPRGPVNDVAAGDMKMLVLGGRDGSGMNIESSWISCSGAHGDAGFCH